MKLEAIACMVLWIIGLGLVVLTCISADFLCALHIYFFLRSVFTLVFSCRGLDEKHLGDHNWTLEEAMKSILAATSC
jgi:hypothetical protein